MIVTEAMKGSLVQDFVMLSRRTRGNRSPKLAPHPLIAGASGCSGAPKLTAQRLELARGTLEDVSCMGSNLFRVPSRYFPVLWNCKGL